MNQTSPTSLHRHRTLAWALFMVSGVLICGGPNAAWGATPPAGESVRLDVEGVQGQSLPADAKEAEVRKIVDGDTIEIVFPPDAWWYKVRLIGINAPESVKPNTPVQCYGKEASHRLADLLPIGATVYLERDVSDKDEFGRLLRHVWVLDRETGRAFLVSELLARGGYVDVRRYPPDDKYDERLARVELAARHENDGLWGACARR